MARSIGVEQRAFVILAPRPLQQLLVGLVINLGQISWGNLVHRLADDLLPRNPQVLLKSLVASQVSAFHVLVKNGSGNCFHQRSQELRKVRQESRLVLDRKST